jgi:hypothetical protein
MTNAFSPPAGDAVAAPAIVLTAARCWRAPRDAGHPVQPSLFAALRDHDCAVLAPVFDSLMALCESALARRFCIGDGVDGVSEDEHLLLDLLHGTVRSRPCFDCSDGIARALDCALCSTRIRMALTL